MTTRHGKGTCCAKCVCTVCEEEQCIFERDPCEDCNTLESSIVTSCITYGDKRKPDGTLFIEKGYVQDEDTP